MPDTNEVQKFTLNTQINIGVFETHDLIQQYYLGQKKKQTKKKPHSKVHVNVETSILMNMHVKRKKTRLNLKKMHRSFMSNKR